MYDNMARIADLHKAEKGVDICIYIIDVVVLHNNSPFFDDRLIYAASIHLQELKVNVKFAQT